MSRQTQGRRWSSIGAEKKLAPISDIRITHDEARTAVNAIVVQAGLIIDHITDYDPRADRFTVRVENTEGKKFDMTIYGETVSRVVALARVSCGLPFGLVREKTKRILQ